jgi:hypothetical protein
MFFISSSIIKKECLPKQKKYSDSLCNTKQTNDKGVLAIYDTAFNTDFDDDIIQNNTFYLSF